MGLRLDLRYKIEHALNQLCDTDIINTIPAVSHSLGLRSITCFKVPTTLRTLPGVQWE